MHTLPTFSHPEGQSSSQKLDIRIGTKGGVNKYPAKSHARRVADKLKSHDGLIVLAATRAENWPNSDMPAPWRQDRYFYYLSGCNEPDCYVSYDIKRDLLTLWLPPINKERVVWYGRGSTVEEAIEKYDVDAAHYIKKPALPGTVPAIQQFFTACSQSSSSDFKYWYRQWELQGVTSAVDSNERTNAIHCLNEKDTVGKQSLRRAVDACRVIKDEHEVELIRRANLITAAAHVNVLQGMHSFESESEVEAAYMQVCIAQKAKEQAYDPIAGSGPNAAELHYSDNIADFGNGQTVVLDAGCEVERYASDVTRTFPINKAKPGYWPSKEAEEIYNLVEKIQESCIKRMLPGNKFIEIFWHSHEMVIEGLLDLGILKGGSLEDIFTTGTSRAFLPHGLGHHVGLEVHDVSPVPHPPLFAPQLFTGEETEPHGEKLPTTVICRKPEWLQHANKHTGPKMLQLDRIPLTATQSIDAPVLEAGMVVTIEPGIYFNKYLLENFFLNDQKHAQYIDKYVLDRYMQVGGVRIEDDILITKDGYENLTTAPKGEEMLEVIRKAAQTSGEN